MAALYTISKVFSKDEKQELRLEWKFEINKHSNIVGDV